MSNLPIRRYMLIQMINDLGKHDINIESFVEQVETVYNNIVVRKDVSNKKTEDALVKLRSILDKICDCYKEAWVKEDTIFDSVYNVFKNAVGFEVKNPIRYFGGKAFAIKPYWDTYQKAQLNLGEDILVYMIDKDIQNSDYKTLYDVCDYLCQDRKRIFREIVFFKDTVEEFSAEERKNFRKLLNEKSIKIRCVFIQEKDLEKIDTIGWRSVFYDVVCRSKNTY